jgi:hypothetical protein
MNHRRPERNDLIEPGEFDRRMVVNMKSARTLFIGAVALYILWFGALVAMAIVSGERPVKGRLRPTVPAVAPADSELPKD